MFNVLSRRVEKVTGFTRKKQAEREAPWKEIKPY